MNESNLKNYKDHLYEVIQSEDSFWTLVEDICQSLLVLKEKEKYLPTLDFVNDVLQDKNEKIEVKFLALRLLGSCILPPKYNQENHLVNKELVTKMLKSKKILHSLFEICSYSINIPDENRGITMFQDQGSEIGQEYLLYALEFVKSLALTWEKTVNKAGEQVISDFAVVYNNLIEKGAVFPQSSTYFDEVKKKVGTQNSKEFAPKFNEISLCIEESESTNQEMLQQLLTARNRINEDTPQKDQESVMKAHEFYQHLTGIIQQLTRKSYSQKQYTNFRKNLLQKAEICFPSLWSVKRSSIDNNQEFFNKSQKNERDSFNSINFGEQDKPLGYFSDFNFCEEKIEEEYQPIQQQERQKKKKSVQNNFIQQDQDNQKNNKTRETFTDSFGFKNDNFDKSNNSQGSSKRQEKYKILKEKEQPKKYGKFSSISANDPQQLSDPFQELDTNQQAFEHFDNFNNDNLNKYISTESPKFLDNQDRSCQVYHDKQQKEERQPANPRTINNRVSNDQHKTIQNSDSSSLQKLQNSQSPKHPLISKDYQINGSFVEFSDLSKSDISAHDFPLRSTLINSKEYRGRLHLFNKDQFQVLQERGLTQKIVRRFKVANLKTKCPLIQSSDFQIGVISEKVFDQNSNRFFIKCDIYFGNKTLYTLEDFNIEIEGDNTSQLYIKNDSFPAIIQAKEQFKLQSLLTYSKIPFSLINVNISGSLNGREIEVTICLPNLLSKLINFNEPSNVIPYFRAMWRAKRDHIIKSDSFNLNKRVIRSPSYFKRYFPQFSENISIDEFILQNQQVNVDKNIFYKLRGTIQLDIPSIEFMIKLIVKPNFTALIQIIPYSGYINTAETLIDHLVFIFGQQ